MDPVKRAATFIRMNDLVIQNAVVIPIIWRYGVGAATTRLQGLALSGWDSSLWNLAHWHKI
jgi:peptide/nickel transport system substrate-binding protein